jgi:hypothetical protein
LACENRVRGIAQVSHIMSTKYKNSRPLRAADAMGFGAISPAKNR